MKKPVNPNYCATVTEIKHLIPIENADAIQSTIVCGSNVVISKQVTVGTKGLFFPLECRLGEEFLKHHNLNRESKLNLDETKAGFFESSGRVRAVKLRGEKSEGFFIPLDGLHERYNEIKSYPIGTDFDYMGDEKICSKYIIREPGTKKEKKIRTTKESCLIDGQFHLHVDTINAKKDFWRHIKPLDLISITDKFHGTSAVFANVLVKKPLTLKNKIAKFFGVDVVTTMYRDVYSSRTVVKNQYDVIPDGFYGTDVWGYFNDQLKDIIPKGISIYGEIVGYVPGTATPIQKGYTYGERVGEASLYVYRVTSTNADGKVIEFTWQQILEFCRKLHLKPVHEFYYGYAKDLYPDISVERDWADNVVSRLKEDFNLEQKCKYNPGMPAEGICIRPDKTYDCTPLKLKSFAFLQHETKLLDEGVSDIESDS